MRSRTISGLVLALVLGAATAGAAQQPAQGQHGGKAKHGMQMRGQHAGFGMLLNGIELTAEQKSQFQQLRARHSAKASQPGEKREEMKAKAEAMRAARERGDTVAIRQFRTERRAEMQQRRDAVHGEIRAILTPAQREVFDRNVAEMKQRQGQHKGKGMQGKGPMQHRS